MILFILHNDYIETDVGFIMIIIVKHIPFYWTINYQVYLLKILRDGQTNKWVLCDECVR